MAAEITILPAWVTTNFVGGEKRIRIEIPNASIASATDWLVLSGDYFTTGCFSMQQSASTDAPKLSADKWADRKATLALSQSTEDAIVYAWGV